MSIVVKAFFLLLGIRRKEEPKKIKKNATKFSKALKQSMSEDVKELTDKLKNVA